MTTGTLQLRLALLAAILIIGCEAHHAPEPDRAKMTQQELEDWQAYWELRKQGYPEAAAEMIQIRNGSVQLGDVDFEYDGETLRLTATIINTGTERRMVPELAVVAFDQPGVIAIAPHHEPTYLRHLPPGRELAITVAGPVPPTGMDKMNELWLFGSDGRIATTELSTNRGEPAP